MTAANDSAHRIVTLDIVRGVAVMGILAMNIIAFAMPFQAYLNPSAFGMDDSVDYASWLLSFVFVDGKMRGLFSLLFGASMLLVIQQAEAKGENAAAIHYRRMAWLLMFGLLHLYLIWFGDILALYALVGMIAWLFRRKSSQSLIRWAIALLTIQLMVFAAMSAGTFYLSETAGDPNAPADVARNWQAMQAKFGVLTGQPLEQKLALFRGPYLPVVEYRFAQHAAGPIQSVLMFGWETLAYFLIGMAVLKTGFLTGDWAATRYRKWALTGLAIAVPAYALLAWVLTRDGFTVPMVVTVVMAATVPFRPLMVIAYAALIILATQRGGWLVDRIAATGRAAFTNYLGTSIVMTALFYGWGMGLYGSFDRTELWLVVVAMWAVMLAWSKPWLDRNRYGPLEWLWRSLSRWQIQPMRKATSRAAVAEA